MMLRGNRIWIWIQYDNLLHSNSLKQSFQKNRIVHERQEKKIRTKK
jgi:hypothetical protein